MSSCHTVYDPEHRIWRGAPRASSYNPDASVGRIALDIMRSKLPNTVCQISDSENTTVTYGMVSLYGIRVSLSFEEIGLTHEHVVAVISTNTTLQLPILLGCWFNGTPFHVINVEHSEAAMKILLETTKPKLIICDGEYYAKIEKASENISVKIYTLCNHVPNVSTVQMLLQPVGMENYFRPVPLVNGRDQVMAILSTAGTDTGVPKCVSLTNANLLSTNLGLVTGSTVFFSFSMVDCWYGLLGVLMTSLMGGIRIITTKPFTPQYMIDIINKYHVNFVITTPLHMVLTSRVPGYMQDTVDTLENLFVAGDYCTPSDYTRMKMPLSCTRLFFGYGCAEFGTITTTFNSCFPKSSGSLLPNLEIKIINQFTGERVTHNTVGKIFVRGEHRFVGYYQDPNVVREELDNEGWFETGDLGYMDNSNDLYWVQRVKDCYKFEDHLTFMPYEIEDVISELKDVLEVCVFSLPDENTGNSAAAGIKRQIGSGLSERRIKDHVEDRNLHRHLLLNAGVYFIRGVIKNANGRVMREKTKEYCLHPPQNGVGPPENGAS